MSQEAFEDTLALIEALLSDLKKDFGQKTWEADLCYVSLLCDSISILVKAIRTQSEDKRTQLLLQIIEELKRVCKTKTIHSTLKLITLNGLGLLYLPEGAYSKEKTEEIICSILEVFMKMLTADSDDIILSETLRATQRLLANMQIANFDKYGPDLFDTCRQFCTRTNNLTRRYALAGFEKLRFEFNFF